MHIDDPDDPAGMLDYNLLNGLPGRGNIRAIGCYIFIWSSVKFY